jgi:hypothetical protein
MLQEETVAVYMMNKVPANIWHTFPERYGINGI